MRVLDVTDANANTRETKMTITIKNMNENYGEPIEVTGNTLSDAVSAMQTAIRGCGPEFAGVEVSEGDYEIVLTEDAIRELGRLTTRDEAGRHFTEWSEHWESLELLGMIDVHRPIHEPTGIPYSHDTWKLEVSQNGMYLIDENEELFCE